MRKALVIRLGSVATLILASITTYADEKTWVANEIFLQLSEMRKEIQQLKQQVGELNGKLRELEGGKSGVPLTATSGMTLGQKSAKVALMEFSDYECPFCGKHALKSLPKLKEKYVKTGQVAYVKRDFPLGFHSQAKKAAIAARCAGEQGQYWPMHDLLFANQAKLGEADLKQDKFRACLADPMQAERVAEDIALGESLGVQGTPAFFVGRIKDGKLTGVKRLDGIQSFETFSGVIDGLLRQQP